MWHMKWEERQSAWKEALRPVLQLSSTVLQAAVWANHSKIWSHSWILSCTYTTILSCHPSPSLHVSAGMMQTTQEPGHYIIASGPTALTLSPQQPPHLTSLSVRGLQRVELSAWATGFPYVPLGISSFSFPPLFVVLYIPQVIIIFFILYICKKHETTYDGNGITLI